MENEDIKPFKVHLRQVLIVGANKEVQVEKTHIEIISEDKQEDFSWVFPE